VNIPLRFFTAAEAHIVQAACARILPSDDSGPGATEAGVMLYIDRGPSGEGLGRREGLKQVNRQAQAMTPQRR